MLPYLKKGEIYPLDRLPRARAHVGQCRYCSAPVLFAPIVKIMINNFKIIAFQLIDSTEGEHHCFKYKLEHPDKDKPAFFKKNY